VGLALERLLNAADTERRHSSHRGLSTNSSLPRAISTKAIAYCHLLAILSTLPSIPVGATMIRWPSFYPSTTSFKEFDSTHTLPTTTDNYIQSGESRGRQLRARGGPLPQLPATFHLLEGTARRGKRERSPKFAPTLLSYIPTYYYTQHAHHFILQGRTLPSTQVARTYRPYSSWISLPMIMEIRLHHAPTL
jgi:hypothetical protein